MGWSHLQIAAAVGCAALALPRSAQAAPDLPADLRSLLGLSYDPPCLVCHDSRQNAETASTYFVRSLKNRGLTEPEREQLRDALTQSAKDKVDSDGDGVTDIAQLRQGRDPSTGLELPKAGCSSSLSPASPAHGASLVTLILALSVVVRRRRP